MRECDKAPCFAVGHRSLQQESALPPPSVEIRFECVAHLCDIGPTKKTSGLSSADTPVIELYLEVKISASFFVSANACCIMLLTAEK